MADIFISYRRADSKDISRRIYDALAKYYGERLIFRDNDKIPKGKNFLQVIERYVLDSKVVLVLIGSAWLDIRNADGQRRLDDPEDFVRVEIDLALRHAPKVIPVLLNGTPMPSAEQLPLRIANLAFQNAVWVNDATFDSDIAELIRAIGLPRRKARLTAALGLVALFIIVGITLLVLNGGSDTPAVSQADTPTVTQTDSPAIAQVTDDAPPTLSDFERLQTAQANGTQAASTQAVQSTLTANAILTAEQVEMTNAFARETMTALANPPTAHPSDTPVPPPPTARPSNTPVPPTLNATESLMAFRPETNDDWTPIEREFDGVMMVLVPAGCFMMGSEDGNSDERPVHEQCFDEPFWIDKYEVSNEQYGGADAYIDCSTYSSEPDQPRNCVTWFEARDFCDARGGSLPTEPQWEYAARGPSAWIYPWGDDYDLALVIGIEDPTYGVQSTAPVGSRPGGASWVGAMDLSGNVWEWTSSRYLDYPYGADHESSTTNTGRVLRGGAVFEDDFDSLRGAYRGGSSETGYINIGFRCVRPHSDQP